MLDFSSPRSSRRFASERRTRRPLLLAILFLGLVVILIDWARKPEHWKWFETLTTSRGEAQIDNRLDAMTNDREGVAIRLPADKKVKGTSSISPKEQMGQSSPPLLGDLPEVPGVDQRYFADIRDNTPFRAAEDDAWFQLWDILQRSPLGELKKFSAGRVSYAQLFRQSDVYRGKLVEVRGTIRRAERMSVPKNALGLKNYYQTWLFPDDNPSSPIVVYCLNLPKNFPQGMNLAEEVALSGFYFKRWVYLAGDPSTKEETLRTAPVLLAKGFQWQPPPPPAPETPFNVMTVTILVTATLGVSLLLVWYVYMRTRRKVVQAVSLAVLIPDNGSEVPSTEFGVKKTPPPQS
jgi:hypothetical protein